MQVIHANGSRKHRTEQNKSATHFSDPIALLHATQSSRQKSPQTQTPKPKCRNGRVCVRVCARMLGCEPPIADTPPRCCGARAATSKRRAVLALTEAEAAVYPLHTPPASASAHHRRYADGRCYADGSMRDADEVTTMT